jgi:hypothetical protein
LEEGGSTQPPLPPTGRVGQKAESGLSKMLTELNLADKYLHKLESQGMELEILQQTLNTDETGNALSAWLERAGVDIVGHRLKIWNYLKKMS